MNLLANGQVLIQDGGNPSYSSSVFTLSPHTNTGSYVNGSWNSTGSLHETRLFYSTVTLPDGRIFAIAASGTKPLSRLDCNLTRKTTEELVGLLNHSIFLYYDLAAKVHCLFLIVRNVDGGRLEAVGLGQRLEHCVDLSG